ncbi:Ig-like domain-containing protein, partial [Mesorhizobium sangaii]
GGTSTHVDTFTVTAADGTSQLVSFTIHGTNDAAVIGTPTVADVTEDTPNSAAVTLTAAGSISISDVDAGEDHFQTTVSGAGTNLGSLVLAANGSYTYSVANAAVQFLAASDANGGTSTHVDTFTVTAADGTSQLVSFTIHGTNDAPVNGVPASQSTDSNIAKVFSSANGNAISISDVDNSSHTVTLTSSNGTLTLSGLAGLSFSVGDGSADGTMTFSGTDATINAALNGLSFAPTNNFHGLASIQITTNDGSLSDTDTVNITVVDTVAPNAPVITSVTDDVSPVTATYATSDVTTNDTDLTVKVTLPTSGSPAEAGDTIRLYNGTGTGIPLGGAYTLTAADIVSGFVSLQTGTLTNGTTYNLTARITDAATNQSAASNTFVVTEDTTAPSAPTALDLAAVDDSGSSSTDNITKNTSALTISGSGENGATVTLFDDANNNGIVEGGESLGTTTVSGGAFSLDVSLAQGTHNVRAIQTDVAGNASAASTSHALDITVDTTAPAAPTITSVTDDVLPVTGTVANGGTSNDTTPTLNGTAEANSTVTIFDGVTQLGTATADGSGAWTFTTSALGQGSHSFTATATDAAGNVGSVSSAYAVTVDTTAPAAPTITSVTDDVLPVTGTVVNGGTSNDTTPTLNGTAEANSIVTIKDGITTLGTATANGAGAWTFTTSALGQGSHSFTATATDAAGNVGSASSAYAVTVDTTAPAAPTITSVTDDVLPVTGTVTNGGASNDTTPTLNGTAEANSIVTIKDGATTLGTATTNGAGAWTFTTSALGQGSHSFTATATDAAGNVGSASSAYAVTVDTTAPAAPTITSVTDDVLPVTGTAANGGTSNDTTPTLNGTAEANSTVTIFDGVTQLGTATADGSGAWTFTTSALGQGSHSFTATATDAAGNVGSVSSAYAVTVDTTAPAAPTITSVTDDVLPVTGTVVNGGASNDTTPTLNGTAEANSIVTIKDGATTLGTATTNGAGAWTFTTSALGQGSHSFTATATDAAGNVGSVSSAYSVTVDTTAPVTPTALDLAAADDTGSSSTDNITKNTSALTISGSGENGATVTLFDDANNNGIVDGGESLGTATVSGGAFSLDVSLAQGTHNVRAIQTDVAGNASAASTSGALSILVDTTNPSTTLTIGSGRNSASGTASDTGGSGLWKVQVTYGAESYLITSFSSGAWSVTFNSPKPTNGQTVTATIFDFAGNTSIATAVAPAGVAGEVLNLALGDLVPHGLDGIHITVSGVPAGWTLSEGALNADGTWTVTTADPGALTVTSRADFTGAIVLDVHATWINADGTTGSMSVSDNVEVFAPGNPIYALSSDDHLTGSSGADLFVFGQPIAADTLHNFDVAADRIDLIGFDGVNGFGDLIIADDGNGNALITVGTGETITVQGVSASGLGAGNFLFNQEPVTHNAGTLSIADGAVMPLGGAVDNTGTIALNGAGATTLLEVIASGITLQGGGQIVLSDSDANVISGTAADVTLTNVDNTISGAGQLGGGLLGLNNQGTIIATGTHALVIDTGSSTVVNSGTLEATGSGGLTINGAVANSGLIWANGGNVAIGGQVTGDGDAIIGNMSQLEFHAASSADVIFGADAAGTLRLDDSFDFSGRIAGITNDDKVDLGDIWYGTGTSAVYQANQDGSGGTLTVSDGTHDAALHLVGAYDAGSFTLADDGTGRTVVGYNPADDFHFV